MDRYSVFADDNFYRAAYSLLKRSAVYSEALDEITNRYLRAYLDFYKISVKQMVDGYADFLKVYQRDIEDFLLYRTIPAENQNGQQFSRQQYDIALLVSVIIAAHRHKLLRNLSEYACRLRGTGLIVGIGSGLDLEIILNNADGKLEIHAFDPEISTFVKERFGNRVELTEAMFESGAAQYDFIIAIELLEHTKAPFTLLENFRSCLKSDGICIVTTTTNVPQFDHVFNFDMDITKQLNTIGLHVKNLEIIDHFSVQPELKAANTWYELCHLN